MADQRTRYARWLEVIARVADGESDDEPYGLVAATFNDTFAADATSWNIIDQRCNATVVGIWNGGNAQVLPPWPEPPSPRWQPLLRWYARTGLWLPQHTDAIPVDVVGRDLLDRWHDVAGAAGMEHELSVPVDVPGAEHSAFVLARAATPFDSSDVDLARTLQPLLSLVLRRCQPMGGPVAGRRARLTARERAVLGLAAGGLTDAAIAHRLSISPRTVAKHLEHVYRKLEASGRMTALLRARRWGLLDDPT